MQVGQVNYTHIDAKLWLTMVAERMRGGLETESGRDGRAGDRLWAAITAQAGAEVGPSDRMPPGWPLIAERDDAFVRSMGRTTTMHGTSEGKGREAEQVNRIRVDSDAGYAGGRSFRIFRAADKPARAITTNEPLLIQLAEEGDVLPIATLRYTVTHVHIPGSAWVAVGLRGTHPISACALLIVPASRGWVAVSLTMRIARILTMPLLWLVPSIEDFIGDAGQKTSSIDGPDGTGWRSRGDNYHEDEGAHAGSVALRPAKIG